MATTITGNTIDVNTAVLNRLSTDGTIVDLQKDGTSVGSIGSSNGAERLYMVNDSTGLSFLGDFSKILPCDSAGAPRDAAIDLGQGSGGRFKDLHLSGGVYLGGTGAANKLDDYEEGTFTPTLFGTGGTITENLQSGTYTKIGRVVTCNMDITVTSVSSPSGYLRVGSLPFTSAVTATASFYAHEFTNNTGFIEGSLSPSLTSISCSEYVSGDRTTTLATKVQAGSVLHSTIVYQAT